MTEIRLELSWMSHEVYVSAAASGDYSLQYQRIMIQFPEVERRAVYLNSADAAPALIRAGG
jgi:hypothetical protein